MIDLARYCGDTSRWTTKQPWALDLGGELWTFATDAHLLVAVPGRKGPNGAPVPMLPEALARDAAYVRSLLAATGYTHQAPLADLTAWTEGTPAERNENECLPGWLGAAVVDRRLLASVLQAFTGSRVELATPGREQVVRLTDGTVRAALMPVRTHYKVLARFDPAPIGGAPC